MSSSVAIADNSENMCNIAGAILWQINSRKGVLVNLAAASTWLIQLMHSALWLPSKIFMFFIICLAVSSRLLLFVAWLTICVSPSIRSAGAVGEATCVRCLDHGASSGFGYSRIGSEETDCLAVDCLSRVVVLLWGDIPS